MSYQAYLDALKGHFHKLTKLEFLQPDDSVAFTLDNNSNRVIKTSHDSRAFIQDGNLDVNLQNGERRKATVTLANIDNAFDYNVNNIWFGQRIRLSMGLRLKDGTDFYLPQGVFYIQSPQYLLNHNTNKVTFNLVDKWSYLDGTLFGNLEATYQIKAFDVDDESATASLLEVPLKYDVLECIKGDGNAYIKTNVSSNKNYKVTTTFQITKDISESGNNYNRSYVIFGGDYNFWLRYTKWKANGVSSTETDYHHFNTEEVQLNSVTLYAKKEMFYCTRQGKDLVCKIKNLKTEGESTQTVDGAFGSDVTSFGKKIYIFRPNEYYDTGTVLTTPMLLYEFAVYNTTDYDETVANFIPVRRKSDGKVGLFETISQTFYTSAGTSQFTAGKIVPDIRIYTNIFDAIQSLLNMSKYDYSSNADGINKIDITPPSFTTYYNDKNYINKDGISYPVTNVPFDISSDSTIADLILQLNDSLVGLIGYDQSGSLRIEPAQAYIRDSDKPVLWYFDLSNPNLCEITETFENEDVKNDIKIIGEGLDEIEIYGRAMNKDPRSDTNINIIGDKVLKYESSTFWNVQQCIDQACYQLKKQTALKKSISIQTTQMFHLYENGVIAIKRTDKKGSPTEKHIIQSLSIPLSQKGTMTINAVSVNDVDIEMTTTSS